MRNISAPKHDAAKDARIAATAAELKKTRLTRFKGRNPLAHAVGKANLFSFNISLNSDNDRPRAACFQGDSP
jgi:hypothetical protein